MPRLDRRSPLEIRTALPIHEGAIQGRLIAKVAEASFGAGTPNQQAHNARLIAAAPDLLAALQKLVEYADNSDDARYGTLRTSLVHDIARAAIAKAKGGA